jgi:transcriptional regulator with PAS, ATPase and Fis domain
MKLKYLSKIKNQMHTVLIQGLPGSGKTHFVHEYIKNSIFSDRPFYHVSVGTLYEGLFESELFGYEKGSFTGALQSRPGFLEKTKNGVLFLDEIGELNLQQQKKLLQILEEKKYFPVGSTECREFSGRIILATHKDLQKMVLEGTFRLDLWTRINQFVYEIPDLNQDLPYRQRCLENIWHEYKIKYLMPFPLSDSLKAKLLARFYSGQIRELKQIIEKLFILSSELEPPEMIFDDLWSLTTKMQMKEDLPDNYYEAKNIFEKRYFEEKYRLYRGRLNIMAKKTTLSKVTLLSKFKHYDLRKEYV